LPKGVVVAGALEVANGDAAVVLVPKGDELAAGLPNGDCDAFDFCWPVVLEDEEKGEAPIFIPEFPNPDDDEVDASFPKPEEDGATAAAAFDGFDDSCNGFGTLYFFASFSNICCS